MASQETFSQKLKSSFPKLFKKSTSVGVLSDFHHKKQTEIEDIPSEQSLTEKENKTKTLLISSEEPEQQIELKSLKNLFVSQNSKRNSLQIPGKLSKLSKFSENCNKNIAEKKKKNFYDVITNFYLIKKFIKVLQTSTARKPKFLNEKHFDLIGDKAFDYFSFKKQQNYEKSFLNSSMRGQNLGKLWRFALDGKTFHPFSKWIFLWNINHLIIFFSCFFIIPINFSFNMNFLEEVFEYSLNQQEIVRLFVAIFYLIDILLNFNLGYYHYGDLVINKKEIAKTYIKQQFFYDLITFAIFLNSGLRGLDADYNSRIIGFLYFLKYFRIRKIFKQIEEFLVVDEVYFHMFSLFLLLVRIFIVSHMAACFWHFLGQPNNNNDNTWLTTKDLVNKPWSYRYVYSLYFIIITMNTVGYGDLTPQNIREILFCIGFVIIGCIMFAYSLNCMGAIFQGFHKREKEMKEELFIINSFMKSKNVTNEVQMKIRKYLEHLWLEEKKLNLEKSMKVFNKLSESLKTQLLQETNRPIVEKLEIFSTNFSGNTLEKIINIMKQEKYPPEEIIFRPGEFRNKDLFFIKEGSVEIFIENEKSETHTIKALQTLKAGNYFGELEFFSEMDRVVGVRSKEYTTVVRFDHAAFKDLIEENAEDKEKFNSIKDDLNVYQNYDDLFVKCYACNQRNHLVVNCPLLHRKFYKDIFLRKYNYSVNQERKKMQRKKQKKTRYGVFEASSMLNTNSLFLEREEEEEEDEFEDEDIEGQSKQENNNVTTFEELSSESFSSKNEDSKHIKDKKSTDKNENSSKNEITMPESKTKKTSQEGF